MEFHRGRLVDHLHLRVKDLKASKRFYRAALGALRGDLAVHDETGYRQPKPGPWTKITSLFAVASPNGCV